MTWKYYVDDSTKGRYNTILGRDLLTALGLDIKFSEKVNLAEKDHIKGVRHLWLT